MLVKNLEHCDEFIAGDKTLLRELLHPAKEAVSISYSLAHAVVKPKQSSQPHRLKSAEVYYILDGQGTMHVDEETAEVHVGSLVYIPPHSTQWIENTGNEALKFLCIVSPPWSAEDEEVL